MLSQAKPHFGALTVNDVTKLWQDACFMIANASAPLTISHIPDWDVYAALDRAIFGQWKKARKFYKEALRKELE